MITKIESEMLECDVCQKHYEDFNGFAIFADSGAMLEKAGDDGWNFDTEQHLCPDCYEIDSEDNLVVMKPPHKTEL